MKHSIEVDANDIALVKIIGDGDEKVAQEFVDTANDIFKKYPDQRLKAMVDMRESGFSNYKGIKVYQDWLLTAPLQKIAFVVPYPAVKVMVEMAIQPIKHKVKFFDNITDATAWLNE